MQRRIILFVFTLFAFSFTASAQEVIQRNGLLSLGSKPFLTYEVMRASGEKLYAYHALGEEETLFQAHMCSNWTFQGGDSYRHYYFPSIDKELILPAKRKYRFHMLLPLMVKEGVLNEDAELNDAALRQFIAKYHVPLPPRFGSRVHQTPVIGSSPKTSHLSKLSDDYKPVEKKRK